MNNLTPDEQRRRLTAVLKAQGLSEAEIEKRLSGVVRQSGTTGAAGQEGSRYPKPPYRFVPLNDDVFMPPAGAPDLSVPQANGLSARLDVTWLAETPILIGEHTPDARDTRKLFAPLTIEAAPSERSGARQERAYLIPGASLRGMLRAGLEAVTFSRLVVDRNSAVRGRDRYGSLPEPHKRSENPQPDFTERLFGYVLHDDDAKAIKRAADRAGQRLDPSDLARRGRLKFGLAQSRAGQDLIVTEPVATIQGAPKPGYGPYYWVGGPGGPRLAGRKRYLPRFPGAPETDSTRSVNEAARAPIENFRQENGQDPRPSIQSRLRFLTSREAGEGVTFTSQIRLENATWAELGAILWMLTFGTGWTDDRPITGHRHMVGRGRPFGAGQLAVTAIAGRLWSNTKRRMVQDFSADFRVPTVSGGEIAHKAIEAFEKEMTGFDANWRTSPQLTDFLKSCDPRTGADAYGKGEMAYASRSVLGEMKQAGPPSSPRLRP